MKIFFNFKPISISLSPNVEKDDVLLALNLIIRPWLWKKGRGVNELEERLKRYLGVKHVVTFNSGRSSLFAILKALDLPSTTPVFLQAFTCNAAVNPFLWAGFKPIYVDCEEKTFNINPRVLEERIKKYKRKGEKGIVMVQHTFGFPAPMDEIIKICEENDLILIEDCAHALGAEWRSKKVGTLSRASFFSFSRDKVISSIYGGAAATNDDEIGKRLRELQKQYGNPPSFWIFQQLLHPILLAFLILPLYNCLDLGKLFLVLSQLLGLLSKAVHSKEKKGKKPFYFPHSLPNALAILALHQLQKLDKFFLHRKKIFEYFLENLAESSFSLPSIDSQTQPSYLRFPLRHSHAHQIIYEAWHKENILLGDWYTSPVAPHDTCLEKVLYKKGTCPLAEKLSQTTLNLPTHINISLKDAERIVKFLKKF